MHPSPRVPAPSYTVAFHTLGCKVNQYETQEAREALAEAGLREVAWGEPADVLVVNTCTVTEGAAATSRRAIRRAAREFPGAVVVAAGCYAEERRTEVAGWPGVDLVVGNADKGRLRDLVAGRLAARGTPLAWTAGAPLPRGISAFRGHTRAFVKVQDGCGWRCSFCIIPSIRPRVRSRPPAEVRAEVARLAAAGYREVVLTGIHLGHYGRGERFGLAELIEELDGVGGLDRVRLSSLEATDLDDRLLGAIAASPKVVPHFHLPLQSGDDRILRAMRRPYDAARFLRVVDAARARLAEPAFSTDVIVGFPGEGEPEFARTLDAVREAAFMKVHVFPYSPKGGTPAAAFPGRVPPEVVRGRCARLAELGAAQASEFRARWVGRVVEVLVERFSDLPGDLREGLTSRYLRVVFQAPAWTRGEIVAVRATAARGDGVDGELVEFCPFFERAKFE